MKKSLSCADMGTASCTFEVRSEKTDEIKDGLYTHFIKYHPAEAAKVTPQQKMEMLNMMDKKMK